MILREKMATLPRPITAVHLHESLYQTCRSVSV